MPPAAADGYGKGKVKVRQAVASRAADKPVVIAIDGE